MIRALFHSMIARIERSFAYDATYMHEIVDVSPIAFFKFALFQSMAQHRGSLPKEAKYAASLAGALAQDCGPCVQIVINMALKDGVAPTVVSGLITRDFEKAGEAASLAFTFADAVARRAPGLEDLREKARARFGEAGLVALAYAVASAQVFPIVKRGLGHAKACQSLSVGAENHWVKAAA